MQSIQKIFLVDEIGSIASLLKECMTHYGISLVTFSGDLGTGKTTIIAQLVAQLGSDARVTSPTFTYVNRYEVRDTTILYHFDLYRIVSSDDFIQMGFADYIEQSEKVIVLIEWPHAIMSLLTMPYIQVTLEYGDRKNERLITIVIQAPTRCS